MNSSIPNVTDLWREIGQFDKKELENSKHMTPVNWEARESARMEAYNKLFDRFLDKQFKKEDCYGCQHLNDRIVNLTRVGELSLCEKHRRQYISRYYYS